MAPLKVRLVFLVFSAALFSQLLAQELAAAEADIASLRDQTTATLEPIIIDAPSVICSEVDQADVEHHSITAAGYADFLNAEAVTDTENFYDEKMSSDPETACIIRNGSPSDFSYEVIEGREDFFVTQLTAKSAACFLGWLQNNQLLPEQEAELTAEDTDFFLGSNRLSYCLNIPPMTTCNSLSEANSNRKSIFDYTPGATAGQRVLEGIGLYAGGMAGIALGVRVSGFLVPEVGCGVFLSVAIPIMVLGAIACAYLGEKLGKWLGS